MIFIAKPNYEEYEMPDGAIIIADSEKEAISIAEKELKLEPDMFGHDTPQKWSVNIVNTLKKGVVMQSIR